MVVMCWFLQLIATKRLVGHTSWTYSSLLPHEWESTTFCLYYTHTGGRKQPTMNNWSFAGNSVLRAATPQSKHGGHSGSHVLLHPAGCLRRGAGCTPCQLSGRCMHKPITYLGTEHLT